MSHALRYGAQRDANETEIIKALQAVGCSVEELPGGNGRPDLLVGFRLENFLMEVKTETGTLNKKQQKFHRRWRGQINVVRSVDDALRVVGAIR